MENDSLSNFIIPHVVSILYEYFKLIFHVLMIYLLNFFFYFYQASVNAFDILLGFSTP